MALPNGTVRLARPTEGALQFIGEDSIDHTQDEDIRLHVGAFDLVGVNPWTSSMSVDPGYAPCAIAQSQGRARNHNVRRSSFRRVGDTPLNP